MSKLIQNVALASGVALTAFSGVASANDPELKHKIFEAAEPKAPETLEIGSCRAYLSGKMLSMDQIIEKYRRLAVDNISKDSPEKSLYRNTVAALTVRECKERYPLLINVFNLDNKKAWLSALETQERLHQEQQSEEENSPFVYSYNNSTSPKAKHVLMITANNKTQPIQLSHSMD